MATSQNNNSVIVEIILKEYESQRSELFIHLHQHQQTLSIVLGSVSIAVPLLLGQLNNIPPYLLVIFLYLLSIIYSIISAYTSQLQFNIDVMGYYIHNKIEPQLNKIVSKIDKTQKVLQWETFIRRLRNKPLVLISGLLGTTGMVLLMALPAGASLFAARYVFSITPSNNFLNSENAILLLGKFAWGAYIVSLAAWTSIIILELFEFRMIEKNENNAK